MWDCCFRCRSIRHVGRIQKGRGPGRDHGHVENQTWDVLNACRRLKCVLLGSSAGLPSAVLMQDYYSWQRRRDGLCGHGKTQGSFCPLRSRIRTGAKDRQRSIRRTRNPLRPGDSVRIDGKRQFTARTAAAHALCLKMGNPLLPQKQTRQYMPEKGGMPIPLPPTAFRA